MGKDLSAILTDATFYIDVEPFQNKGEMFQQLANWYAEAELIEDINLFIESLYEREALGSTFMGNAIALPHAKSESVLKPSVMFCRTKVPFLYESGDEQGMVQYIFMLAVSPEQSGEEYIRMLADLAGLLANDDFLEKLAEIKTLEEFLYYAVNCEE